MASPDDFVEEEEETGVETGWGVLGHGHGHSPATSTMRKENSQASLATFSSEAFAPAVSPSADIPKPDTVRRLSTTSRKFDREGKGYLDETELALRRMDSRNVGMLDVHKVYDIMKTLQDAQKDNAQLLGTLRRESQRNGSLRRAIVLLCVFSFLLSLANIGTSFAAARLAKDTRVNANGDLESTNTKVRLGTTAKEVTVTMEPLSESTRRSRRLRETSSLLCGRSTPSGVNCTVQGEIRHDQAKLLYDQFCPSRTASGRCAGQGVRQVQLNCNGHFSTIYGGSLLPDTPPSVVGDFVAYPTDGRGYVADAAVHLFGILLPCVQGFSLSMYCPIDNTDPTETCLVFSAWEPTCMGRVVLCGPTTITPSPPNHHCHPPFRPTTITTCFGNVRGDNLEKKNTRKTLETHREENVDDAIVVVVVSSSHTSGFTPVHSPPKVATLYHNTTHLF